MGPERLVRVPGRPPKRHLPVPLVENEAVKTRQDASGVPADQPEPVALLGFQAVQHRGQVAAVAPQETVVGDVPRLLEARFVGRVMELVRHAIAQQVDDDRSCLLLRRRRRPGRGDDPRLCVPAADVLPIGQRPPRPVAETVRLLQKDEPVGVGVGQHEPIVGMAQFRGETQLRLHLRRSAPPVKELISLPRPPLHATTAPQPCPARRRPE